MPKIANYSSWDATKTRKSMQTEPSQFGNTLVSLFSEAEVQHGDVVAFTSSQILLLRGEFRIGQRVVRPLQLTTEQRTEKPVLVRKLGDHKEISDPCLEDLYIISSFPRVEEKNLELLSTTLEAQLLEHNLFTERYTGEKPSNWILCFRLKSKAPLDLP